jgi:hypothetical protein
MNNTILDQVLLPLADQFEAGNDAHWYGFQPVRADESEPLRECIAELVAEGSVVRNSHRKDLFQFVGTGYWKYLPRIKALRAVNVHIREGRAH